MSVFDYRRFACALFYSLLIICCSFSDCSAKEPITSIQQLNDPAFTITVTDKGAYFDVIKKEFPKAKIIYLEGQPAYDAVKMGRADAYAYSRVQMEIAIADGLSGVKILPGNVGDKVEIAVGISRASKIPDLRTKINLFISELKASGTLQDMYKRWVINAENTMPEIELPSSSKLKIVIGTSGLVIPFSYYEGITLTGFDIELGRRLAKRLGAEVEFRTYDYGGLIAAAHTGEIDCIMANLNVTPERKEKIDFSDVLLTEEVALMIKDNNMPSAAEIPSSLKDFDGKKIGIILGANHDIFVAEKIPNAQIEYFSDLSAITLALKTGKIDAFTNTLPTAIYMTYEHKDMSYISEPLENTYTYSAFTNSDKGHKFCDEYAEFVKSLWDNGTIKQLLDKWIYSEDELSRTTEDYSKLPADNGILKMAIDTGRMPFAYVKDNKITGYDIDIATMFCKAKGYGLEVYSMNFAGILGSIKTGKCDLTGSITRTEERAETMLFSPVPNAETPIVLIVMKSAETVQPAEIEQNNFFDNIKSSFERTFIREDRWQLFVEGIISTMIITVFSILGGTILGFIVYLSCRGGNIIANLVTRFFVWLIQGMPMVVLLMILYYIIFGNVDIAGIWVAVIAFSLTFGAGVYGMLLSGVNALDKGQLEAAYALGFTDRRAFFTIILPQAALHFMPAYKAEVVALIKATAIVGYIAVQDLTKMGDIVRSRTYEAFFPLIAVAVIYFVLAGMLNIIVNIIHNRIKPEKRTKNDILRGIEIHD